MLENDNFSINDNASADFIEPEDTVIEHDKPLEDAILDEPQLLPFLTVSTPSPEGHYVNHGLFGSSLRKTSIPGTPLRILSLNSA